MSEGAYVWLIPDGYIPEGSTSRQPSHEAICEDRVPIKDVRVTVPPERTRHIRTDLPEHLGGATVPKGVPYAVRVACDVPVTVQHSRMDTSQEALALMSTMAHPVR